jgi:CheY-like chemotaxis protein
MLHSMNDNNPLSGLTVLVVEDDLFLAMALEDTLVGMGAVVVDVCHTLDEGMARADADDFAVAVLDFSLGSHSVTPLARRLARGGVPFSTQACRAANQACRSGGTFRSWRSQPLPIHWWPR